MLDLFFGGTVLELYYKLFSYLCIQSASIIFSSLDTFLTVYSLLSQEIGELKWYYIQQHELLLAPASLGCYKSLPYMRTQISNLGSWE